MIDDHEGAAPNSFEGMDDFNGQHTTHAPVRGGCHVRIQSSQRLVGGPVAFKKFNSFRGPGRIAVRHGAAFSSITNRPDILIFIISLFKNKNVYISFTEQSSCQRVPI